MHHLGSDSARIATILLAVAIMSFTACGQVVTPSPTAAPLSAIAPTESSAGPGPRPTRTALPLPPPDAATPTITPTPVIHVVEQGDTLQAIAFDYGVSVAALQRANGIENPQFLQVGQQLVIPLGEERDQAAPNLLLPTPTPQPAQVQGTAFFRTPVGSLWGLGEVANTTTTPLTNVQVRIVLFDGDGQVVVETDTFVAADLIQPGERSPFGILFLSPPNWDSYQVTIVRADSAGALVGAYVPISVTEASGKPSGSQFEVSGTLEHVGGGQGTRSIDVIVTTYDAEGAVTGFRQHTIELDGVLTSGETASFAILLTPHGDPPAGFSVIALGRVSQA